MMQIYKKMVKKVKDGRGPFISYNFVEFARAAINQSWFFTLSESGCSGAANTFHVPTVCNLNLSTLHCTLLNIKPFQAALYQCLVILC